ncbi:hypothetical protein Daus18300_013541 [Diaporthe australafricana]|uniref:Heterokaryon incompatibility domain-containing protein n=1 Tax=Diaporthe australafricana TaxID=127596 RepID=A0ABR3VYU1_9PEZI
MNLKALQNVRILTFALLSIASAGTDIYFFAGDHCLDIMDVINHDGVACINAAPDHCCWSSGQFCSAATFYRGTDSDGSTQTMYFTNGSACLLDDNISNFRRHIGSKGSCLSIRKDQDNSKCSAFWQEGERTPPPGANDQKRTDMPCHEPNFLSYNDGGTQRKITIPDGSFEHAMEMLDVKEVTKLQNDYAQALALDHYSEDEIASVARLVREVPARIYIGIVNSLKPEEKQEDLLEVWHDYISVPQWCHERKSRIIQAIPELYSHASFVVPFFSDLAHSSVQAMRNGSSTEERVRGIVDVCNSKWFRRIWTAMECVQSSQLRPMLQDYKLLDEFRPGLPFYDEPTLHWEDEVRRTIREHVVRLARVGKNVLPHMLGPLSPVRTRRLRGLTVPFAHCFILISRRQATVPVDLIHALLGLTGPVVEFSKLPHQDLRKSVSMIAKARLRAGDFSPLFLMPRKRHADGIKVTGFDEHGMFGLGMEESCPEFSGIDLSGPGESTVKLKAENIGTVTMAKRVWKNTDFGTFHELVRKVLDITGPDPDIFAETICCRFFGDDLKQVRDSLGKGNRRSQLQVHLEVLYDEYPGVKRRSATDFIAQLLELNEAHKGNISSSSAMDFSKISIFPPSS